MRKTFRSVVVTDGEQRSALAIVRSLGRAGYTVHVCAGTAASISAASRYAESGHILPSALVDPDAYVTRLRDVCIEVAADVIIPVTEQALLAVLPARSALSAAIPFPPAQTFEHICDKQLVLSAAAACGIAVPAQTVVADRSALATAAVVKFPVVLKPSRSVVGARGARQKTSVLYANDRAELLRHIDRLPDAAFPILCQQRIQGEGTAVSLLVWDGEVKAAFGHRRLREKPPSGGVSVLRESVALDHTLLARSAELLRHFAWEGVAMVEFKIDQSTGTPYLMEINGRFWGSLQLAIDAGIDFPALLLRCAGGDTFPPQLEYPAGVRTRWEWGEVDHLLARLFHSGASLNLTETSPSRLQTLASILASAFSGTHNEVFSRDDMKPFLRESLNWLRRR